MLPGLLDSYCYPTGFAMLLSSLLDARIWAHCSFSYLVGPSLFTSMSVIWGNASSSALPFAFWVVSFHMGLLAFKGTNQISMRSQNFLIFDMLPFSSNDIWTGNLKSVTVVLIYFSPKFFRQIPSKMEILLGKTAKNVCTAIFYIKCKIWW